MIVTVASAVVMRNKRQEVKRFVVIKQCFKCLKELPIDEFYKHPRMGDGHLNKCKECTRRDTSKNYQGKREQYAEYERKRFTTARRKAQILKYDRNRRVVHPDKCYARAKVGNSVRNGKLKKEPCKFCGNTKVQAHHEDYSKPLDVIWVCFKCHREKFHNQIVISDF